MRALADLLAGIQERGAAVIVRGEAGIGKSSLVAAASDRARERGVQVLTAAAVQCETHLPFAGLHQLLLPILADADRLPPPQRRAVDAAFGVVDERAPEPFVIALATLQLLSDAAARAPLLLIVEDAHDVATGCEGESTGRVSRGSPPGCTRSHGQHRHRGRPWGFALEDVAMKVHIYQGELDSLVLPAAATYMAERLPNCELH